MKIIWHGHACFEARSERFVIVFDPHDGASLGLPKPKFSSRVDLVLISHEHFDHNARRAIPNRDAKVLSMFTGETSFREVRVKGVQTYHDEGGGRERGRNTVYIVEVDGLKLCHLGDLGHVLTHDHTREIGDVDVLFVPVGGVFTIDGRSALRVVDTLNPRIAVPMHYAVTGLNLPLNGVEAFIRSRENVDRRDSNVLEVTAEKLPEETTIVVLEPPQLR